MDSLLQWAFYAPFVALGTKSCGIAIMIGQLGFSLSISCLTIRKLTWVLLFFLIGSVVLAFGLFFLVVLQNPGPEILAGLNTPVAGGLILIGVASPYLLRASKEVLWGVLISLGLASCSAPALATIISYLSLDNPIADSMLGAYLGALFFASLTLFLVCILLIKLLESFIQSKRIFHYAGRLLMIGAGVLFLLP